MNSGSFAYDGASVSAANAWSASTSAIDVARRDRTAGRVHGAREVAPLRQLPGGAPQPIDRRVLPRRRRRSPARLDGAARGARLPADPASCAWIQRAERLVEQPLGLRLGQDGEQRIDARFDRPLAQQLGAEAVDGADVRFFERLQRLVRARSRSALRRLRPRDVERLAQPQLQLAGRLLGEGHRDDVVDLARARSRGCGRCGSTSSVVLPVPAAASTTSVSSSAVAMRVRASAIGECSALMASCSLSASRSPSLLRRLAATRRGSSGPHTGTEVAPGAGALAGRGRQEAELDRAIDDLERLEPGAPVAAR